MKNLSAAVVFALFLCSVPALACTCVYTPVKAGTSFRGRVFGIAPGEKAPAAQNVVAHAAVKLWITTDEKDTLVAQAVADENGRFVLENVKPGNYVLRVSAAPQRLQDIAVMIKISPGASSGKKELVIGLPPSPTCCQAYIKMRKAGKKL